MSGLVSGITGAAPIWNDIMSNLLKNKSPQPMTRPTDIIQKQVCSDTGFIPTSGNTCSTKLEYFIKGNEKNSGSVETKDAWVDKTTQDLPQKGQTENLELKNVTVYTDPTGDQYCITCPHPTPTPTQTPTR
jgi:membrane carboxypeptidase/penicillin-binding protein